jgi:hypothetical protein
MPVIYFCWYPECTKAGKWRRQNTAYLDDLKNYSVYCDEHQKYADECWQEQWDEYYHSIR